MKMQVVFKEEWVEGLQRTEKSCMGTILLFSA